MTSPSRAPRFHQRFISGPTYQSLNPTPRLPSTQILKQEMKKKHCNSESKQDLPQHSLMVRRSARFRPSAQQGVPWADHLPTEILSRIVSKHVTSADRYVSLRRVCREWRRSLTIYSPSPPLPSPQVPFLLLPRHDADHNAPLGKVFPLPFPHPYSFSPTLSLPQLEQTLGCICIGSSHGWLITLSLDSSISLVNPVTGDSFKLPPLSSIDNTVLSFNPSSYPEYHLPQKRRFSSQASIIHRAVLSSYPVKDPRFTVLLFFSGLTDCCYTCTKDSITWNQHFHEPFLVEDVIFFNGVFVAIDLSTNLAIFDFTNLDTGLVVKQQRTIWMKPKIAFLVEAAGKLLLVASWVSSNRIRFPRGSIRIFEIDMSGGARSVQMLSQYSLFVAHGCSVSVSTQLFPWLPEDNVYFPHVHTKQRNDEDGREITLRYAGVYGFTPKWGFTRKVFSAENHIFAPLWAQLRFFWVVPNLNQK